MQIVKENKAFNSAREKTEAFFARKDLYFSRDSHLCFVCGGADPRPGEPPRLRRQFLDWAKENEPKLVCVLAENAVTDLLRQVDERRKNNDLGVIENMIADTVDSLLIFPESAGSFAELGLFSANDEICKKMMIAILAEHQGDSFLTLGPIKAVGLKSTFLPLPIVLREPYGDTFRQIADRLLGEAKNKRNYRRRYSLKEWKEYDKREQLAILDCIFDLIGICTEDDLFEIILKSFGSHERSEIRLLTGLLVALDRLIRTESADIVRRRVSEANPFIEGGDNEATEIKAKWRDAYADHLPEAIDELERLSR